MQHMQLSCAFILNDIIAFHWKYSIMYYNALHRKNQKIRKIKIFNKETMKVLCISPMTVWNRKSDARAHLEK